MISSMVPLIHSWLPIWNNYLRYMFALAFIAFVGCFIHSLFRR